jgi:kynureninase
LYIYLKKIPVDPDLIKDDEECVYLCGNSLGLLPSGLKPLMSKILDEWGQLCVYVFWENELFLKNNLNNNHQEDRNCC